MAPSILIEGHSSHRMLLPQWMQTRKDMPKAINKPAPLNCRSATKQGQTTAQRLLVEELTRESTLMAALRHPNIVLFLGISLEPPCMLTEFCARGSLLDVLHRARNIEVGNRIYTLRYLKQANPARNVTASIFWVENQDLYQQILQAPFPYQRTVAEFVSEIEHAE